MLLGRRNFRRSCLCSVLLFRSYTFNVFQSFLQKKCVFDYVLLVVLICVLSQFPFTNLKVPVSLIVEFLWNSHQFGSMCRSDCYFAQAVNLQFAISVTRRCTYTADIPEVCVKSFVGVPIKTTCRVTTCLETWKCPEF